MKTVACALLFFTVASAEPARYRQARFNPVEQELPLEGEKEATTAKPSDAPASGYAYTKPAVQFNLPTFVPFRQVQFAPPSTSYGIPADSYGAPGLTYYTIPAVDYGFPVQTEPQAATEKPVEEKKEEPTTEKPAEPEPEPTTEEPKPEPEPSKTPEVVASGAYYVLLPTSEVQRVQFRTENDIANMAYTAKIQYKNEDRAPIFIYTNIPQPCSACGPTAVVPCSACSAAAVVPSPKPYYYY